MAGLSDATVLTPSLVTGTGGFNGSVSLLTDGYFPPESTQWQTNTVWWNGTTPIFTFNYGSSANIEDIFLSVDNNDSYKVDYSADNVNWNTLFTISSGYGETTWGMDTMSTLSSDPEYVAGLDFSPVSAQYLRIYATGGDNYYSVGEFQAYGTNPVPEPATMLLFGSGLAGLLGILSRRKNQ